MILSQEDMPFTKDGIVPDIIINPHAIPSRMTLGQLIECVMGKSCCMLGAYADATPFTNIDNNEIYNILEQKCNYQKHGDEVLYSGINGKQLSSKIFIGPTYYQRLKHMVKDKMNSRQTGAVSLKTKQPPSGRSVGGGLRIGEMERDAILSHGALQFLKESMLERSDKYSTHISTYSGLTSIVNSHDNRFVCPSVDGPLKFNDELNLLNDNSSCDIVKVNIPYNTHLLMQECNAMSISMRLIIDKESDYEKLDIPNKQTKFVLQDGDKRKMIIAKKETTKMKFIPKTKKNKEKFINDMKYNKVLVSNLADSVTIKDIRYLFESIGKIFEIRTNDNHTFIIIYTSENDAKKSITELNNVLLDGKRITISLSTQDISSNFVEPLFVYGAPRGVGFQGVGEIPMFDPNEFPGIVPTSPLEPYVPQSPDYSPPKLTDYVVPPSPEYLPPSNLPDKQNKWWFENEEYNIDDYALPKSPDYALPKSPDYPQSQQLVTPYGANRYDVVEFDDSDHPGGMPYGDDNPYDATPYGGDNPYGAVEFGEGDHPGGTPYGDNPYGENVNNSQPKSLMNILNEKELKIKEKYDSVKKSNGLGGGTRTSSNKSQHKQTGGGGLDFSALNLGDDNLLTDIKLEGYNVNGLSAINTDSNTASNTNTTDSNSNTDSNNDIKHVVINLPKDNSETHPSVVFDGKTIHNELHDNFNGDNIIPYDNNEQLGDVVSDLSLIKTVDQTNNEPTLDSTNTLIDNLEINITNDLNEINL